MKIEKTRVDSKGRVVIPKSFRDSLAISVGDSIFLSLDEENRSIIISQYKEKDVYQILIEMGDAPGTLVKMAEVLFNNNVDLISTESHSVMRTHSAFWRVLCSMKGVKMPELKKQLVENGAKSVKITKI